ncbi:DUF3048 domain-containing protein [Nocardioides mesophilus]|uniref:DUF3048 domain-containing protein n=1 Tax=Nocardioides mesophilus TaxID=433659 RepID=A0A7G9RD49_9ACTN|nr:DUF3048 domain-containing protein [Nocardioides mesophilus]QNN53524.1 DUF3048 domain-containing protein [Nocardioides mesophilus]
MPGLPLPARRRSPRTPRPSGNAGRRRAAALALTAVAALTLAGCSGGSDDSGEAPAGGPESQSVADGMTLSGQWPLTGLPADGKAPAHPVMVVKIDNTGSSEPQVGLGKADLVTEELVEGGSTRLAVFYYSQLPKTVGPVRSMRASDIGIVEPADAVLIASGGAPPTVKRLADAGVKTYTEGATGFFRDSGRPAPYNLMMDLPKLAATLKASEPPDNYFPWGSAADFPQGRPAKRVSAVFSGGHTTTWQFEKGHWTNLNSFAAAGDRFTPSTLLVLRVQVGDAGYRDPAGNPVPETKFTGTGEAMVFHDGEVVRGSWKKDGLDGAVELSTKAGELTLPPGKVWMELVPAKGGNVTIG